MDIEIRLLELVDYALALCFALKRERVLTVSMACLLYCNDNFTSYYLMTIVIEDMTIAMNHFLNTFKETHMHNCITLYYWCCITPHCCCCLVHIVHLKLY